MMAVGLCDARAFTVFLFVVMALTACAGPSAVPDPPDGPVPVQRFRPEATAYRAHSGFDDAARLIVRDQATWSEVWHRIHAGASPGHEAPAVDFAREMVLVAALGQRPTGGYDILIEDGVASADGLRVRVVLRTPGPTCIVPQVLTEPIDLARLPRHSGEVRFDERTEVQECP